MNAWISSAEAAELLGVSTRHIPRLMERGIIVGRRTLRGANAKAIDVLVSSLPLPARNRFLENAAPAPIAHPSSAGVSRFATAKESERRRVLLREQAVLAYRTANAEAGSSFAECAEAFRVFHSDFHISERSLRRWVSAYREQGRDGLVDGNDGHARRGKFSVPAEALDFFLQAYLDPTVALTISAAIRRTRDAASEFGWKLPRRDDAFYRFARTIPAFDRQLFKESFDTPGQVRDFVRRGMDQPYRSLQSDHHLVDVFVSCEATICGDAPCKGHRPWWTPMFDVGSRKIISYRISLDQPNSRVILEAFRAAVELEGLPDIFYVDNGKDFKKATGKGIAEAHRGTLDDRFNTLGVTVRWALPYNARAKSIERMFRTFIDRVWRTYETYTGPLGKRSEHAEKLRTTSQLPTFGDFCEHLDYEVQTYNATAHRGEGMNGRTPNEAFRQDRIARRDVDPAALALVFYRPEKRVLQRDGFTVDGVRYRVESPEVQRQYQGREIRALINPDDVQSAVVCSPEGAFLCNANVRELADHTASSAVTQQAFEAVRRQEKAVTKLAKEGNGRAQLQLQHIKRNRLAIARKLSARHQSQERELSAAVGQNTVTTAVLPSFSRIARDSASYGASDPGVSLSPEQLKKAASAPDHTEQYLEAWERSHLRGLPSEPQANEDDADAVDYESERQRVAAVIERKRKIAAGECLDCSAPAYDDYLYCSSHWRPTQGD